MPYPNFHAARLVEPERFEPGSMATIPLGEGTGVTAIVGRLKGEETTTRQAIRFDRTRFAPKQAREWLAEHKLEPILFEEATGGGERGDSVVRYDSAPLLSCVRTPEGYLLAEGYAGRAGVLTYRQPDGSQRYELIPPDELFNVDSLATLARKPVTLQHPAEGGKPVQVDSTNVGRFEVGDVDGMIDEERMGGFVRVRVAVRRADAVASVESGVSRGLSMGYVCDLDETPGTWNGTHYDAVQRNRRYNHLALCGLGRAGGDAKLHVDAAEAVDGPAWPAWHAMHRHNLGTSGPAGPPQQEDRRMSTNVSFEIGGVRYDGVDPSLAQAIQAVKGEAEAARADAATYKHQFDALMKEMDKTKASYDAQMGELWKKHEELKGKMAGKEERLAQLEAGYKSGKGVEPAAEGEPDREEAKGEPVEDACKRDAADESAFQARFDARVALLGMAAKVGVQDAAKMPDAALRRAIVVAHNPKVRSDASDAYLATYIDVLADQFASADASHSVAAQAAAGGAVSAPVRQDAAVERQAVRAEYMKSVYGD